MHFDLSEDQQLLVDTVASFVRKESPVSRLRTLRQDAIGYSRKLWRQMGDQGWIGVLYPESVGGSAQPGTSPFVDAALIIEQLGTTLVPEPYLASILAGVPLLHGASDEQKSRWLAPLVAGEISLALAYAEVSSRFETHQVGLTAKRKGNGYQLNGEKRFVLNGHAADAIVVSARTAGGERDHDGVSLFVVDGKSPGLTVQSVKTMDGHRAALLRFENVTVDADRLIGAEGKGAPLLELAMDHGAAAACAEGTGITRTVLDMTTEYLRTREQFGVKIGTFQALQHRAVDMFVECQLCQSTSIMAAIKVAEADANERRSAISAAKVQLAVGGRYVTQQAIQLHGGIGVTDEHDVGLYFKRMHVLNSLFGDEEFHVARYASLPGFTAGL